jgi:hypothetical protein
MTTDKERLKELTLKQLNSSGFPFQLKVEQDIRATCGKDHNWAVASREHPWSTAENTGFIDLVLKHNEYSTFRLVIECKRLKADDARQLQWLFLAEEGKEDSVARASCFEVETNIGARLWDDVRVWPASLEAEFCVLQGDEPRRGRAGSLLENLSRDLLEATEGLALEEVKVERSTARAEEGERPLHLRLFLFPVIVTNAKIVVCRFNPSHVSLEHGTLESDDAEIFEVPFIRFRKSLAIEFPEDGVFYHLEAANRARERSVLVVNASHISDILKDWKVERMPNRNYAIEELLNRRRL